MTENAAPTQTGDTESPSPQTNQSLAETLLESLTSAPTTDLQTYALALRVKADFLQTLLAFLTLNILYMYYVDHKFAVLLIRAAQTSRLMFFPTRNSVAQRGVASLVLLSNVPVLLIHFVIFERGATTKMLVINFLATEPRNLIKIFYIDILTIAIQIILIQCMWADCTIRILSSGPRPAEGASVNNGPSSAEAVV